MSTLNDMIKTNGLTILIVDDSKTNLYLLSELLSDYNIITAESGSLALKIAKKEHLSLILLDIVMPEMNGYEVCERLKSIEQTRDVPVIFISSQTDEESIDKAYRVGGVDYINKPFASKELLARVKTQLSYSEIQKNLKEKISLIDKYVSYSSTDLAGNIVEVSEAFCKLSGYKKEELLGKNHNILRHPDMDSKAYDELWNAIKNGSVWEGEIKNKSKSGKPFWSEIIISPRFDEKGKVIGYTGIRHDISNEKRIQKLSITDQLTNLYNRRYFNDIFSVEIKRSKRNNLHFSFAMLDIDFFKQYNDTYGHQSGDEVLEKIGALLNKELYRAEDMAFRLGGEEFGIVFVANSIENSKKIIERIRKAVVELKIEHKNSKISKFLTSSFGLVCIDFSKKDNEKLNETSIYKLADDELYKAKKDGRNRLFVKEI